MGRATLLPRPRLPPGPALPTHLRRHPHLHHHPGRAAPAGPHRPAPGPLGRRPRSRQRGPAPAAGRRRWPAAPLLAGARRRGAPPAPPSSPRRPALPDPPGLRHPLQASGRGVGVPLCTAAAAAAPLRPGPLGGLPRPRPAAGPHQPALQLPGTGAPARGGASSGLRRLLRQGAMRPAARRAARAGLRRPRGAAGRGPGGAAAAAGARRGGARPAAPHPGGARRGRHPRAGVRRCVYVRGVCAWGLGACVGCGPAGGPWRRLCWCRTRATD
jgi:translation initiation factor IF-2